jgi:pimeloyl-ACP methyl ester carboxylesterase
MQEGFVVINGLRLHYLEWPGPGPVVTVGHATGFLAWLWEPVARYLARHFHVYAYDARGHGDSDKPPQGYSWSVLAADYAGLVEALGLGAVLPVAHSVGCAAALAFAARHPDRVQKLVFIEPSIFPLPTTRYEGIGGVDAQRYTLMAVHSLERVMEVAAAARRRRSRWPSRDAMLGSYSSRAPFNRWNAEVLRLYVERGTRQVGEGEAELKCPPEIEAQVFEGYLELDAWSLAPYVKAEALVLTGSETEPIYSFAASELARRLGRARLRVVEGASHFLPMERPELVAEIVLDFLQG